MKKNLFFLCFSFFIFSSALYGQKITYRDHTFRLAPLPPLKNAKNSKAKWGLYFWEFGDGHYKITEKPKVNYSGYAKSGNQEVRVQLVPYYTVVERLPEPIKTTVSVKKGRSKINYDMDGKAVYMESSANGELVPGHDIRLALHYKAPASGNLSGGYLALFYNNTEEVEDKLNISFKPFSEVTDYSLHYDEVLLSTSNPDISGARLKTFNRLKNEHDDFVLFETSSMNMREDRRVFFTIKSNEKLKNSTGNKDNNLSFTALWIPALGDFKESSNVMTYKMKVLKVHDPNNMRVIPKVAIYRKRKKQIIDYRINFQNEAEGIVRDAKIAVHLGKGLDRSTLKVLSVSANKRKWKFDCTDTEKQTDACFDVVNKSDPDSLYFYFHNIDLLKKTFFNGKKNRGFVHFNIESDKKAARTKSRVGIMFDGEEPIITKWAKTKWREKGLFVKGGLKFNTQPSNYTAVTDKEIDRMAIGLWYQNAPVGRGLSWGLAFDYAAYRVEREEQIFVPDPDPDIEGTYLTQSEDIKLNLGEIKLHGGYQFGQVLKVYATSGISLPIASRFDFGAQVQYELGDFPILEDKVKGGFGLFGKDPNPVIFDKTINTRSFIGYVGSLGIELGVLNSFTVGLQSEYRYFNNFYYTNHDCFKMTNLEAYVRFKLFTL